MKRDPSLIPHTKINSKQIKDQNIRSKNVKLLQGNIGGKCCPPNTGMSNNFSDMTPGMQETEAKIDIWGGGHQTLNICSKGNSQQGKRHPREWEKKFRNHTLGKGLISRIFKELLQHYNSNDKIIITDFNVGKGLQ